LWYSVLLATVPLITSLLKLTIMPTDRARAFSKEFLLTCTGYDPLFLDQSTAVSLDQVLPASKRGDLPEVENNDDGVLHYTGMSVLYNAKRKAPFVAAYNINGKDKANAAPRPDFVKDPRIDPDVQLGDDFYDLRKDITEFEIGHMASNAEMGRGPDGVIRACQTFHFTNSVPQAERLNTGLWRTLESYIIREAATVQNNKHITVFTGPVLTVKDPGYKMLPSFKIPLLFYKVILFAANGKIFSTAFMMSHEKKLIEDGMFAQAPPVKRMRGAEQEVGFFTDFPYRKVFQVNIPFLEKHTGLRFSWTGVTPITVPEQKKLIELITGIGNTEEAKVAAKRGMTPRGATLVEAKEDDLSSDKFLLNVTLPG
jgi:DNA/RNA endonuclease G (NUC1)